MLWKARHAYLALAVLLTLAIAACSKPPTQLSPAGSQDGQTQSIANAPTPAEFPAATQNDAQNSPLQRELATPKPKRPTIIPAGATVTVRLQQALSSAHAYPGERFEAVLDESLATEDGRSIPAGTPVLGHVVSVHHSGRLHHPGEIGLTLDTLVLNQQRIGLTTSSVVARGGSHKKRNLAWIGGGTGGGALIGALAGGGKGALIGSGIGAAAGTTTAFFTGKKDVGFAAERRLRFRIDREVQLQGSLG